ncbi:MAG: 2-hydroxyacid dehydrogenase [Pseudomonadota bacterium]|nr:2-hydroxyacid dehydrogenase [Pseudomonadota bacterium]
MQIAVFSAKPYDQAFLLRAATAEVEFQCFELQLNPSTAVMAQGAVVVSAFVNDDLGRETLSLLAEGGTRLIALRCAGYNQVDLAAAAALGIRVVNVPAYSPYAVAEHTIALMLALSRKLPRAYNRIRDGNFSLDGLLGFDFYAKTLGVIGGGKIGQLVAERMRAFGCRILIYDPFNEETCRRLGFESVDLDSLFEASDIISLHCPLNDQTRHLINRDSVAQMKPGVMLINTSRGALMDTQAVLDGLKAHHIAYLGMDVYEQEGSLFFEDHSLDIIQDDVIQRLITLPNVIVTGHQAYFTKEALQHIAETTVSNILEYLEDKPLTYQVGG